MASNEAILRLYVRTVLTYRFTVIIYSLNIFVEVLRGGLLHYLIFHLQEHVVIAIVSPLARNIFEICSQFFILLISKEMEHWKTDF